MEETNRQKKIAGVIQKDLAEVLQADARNGLRGVIISVSKVSVTADLGQAKAYLSVFPSDKREAILKAVTANTPAIRHELAQRTKHQLRRMPNLLFFGDDSLDYIENIDDSLNGKDVNPIHNPEILDKRKKS
ncbi:30S ribosome-binding factor RbfA [Wenyingzhuangia sp. IMCC45533]